ncbi:MAG TPA: hypothetical protein ENK02_06905 [Planctomycetes bacterium]|nr:hypothetical protein [Planctomycetota bacterium]
MKHESQAKSDPATGRPRALGLPLFFLLLLPFFVSWFAGPQVPVGDDWKLFENLDQLSFHEAILVNTRENEGLRFRPLVNGMVWIERQILGLGFRGNTRLGLLWIGISGAALFLLLLRIGLSRRRAWLGSVLFLAHPAAAEMYGWASTRLYSMGSAFSLLALLLGLGGKAHHALLAGLFFLLAFLSAEATYPLLLGAPLFFWILSRRKPVALLSAPFSLGSALGLKKLLLGRVFASWWTARIPLWIRLKGWLLLALPLLLWPVGTFAAEPLLAKILAVLYAGGMLLALLLPFLRGRFAREENLPRVLAFGVLFLLTLSVTGGVPPRADLGGGRVWFLPSAFFCAAVAVYGNRSLLTLSAPIGLGLLLLNLAPWAQARTKMQRVLSRLEREVPRHERALEVTNLEPQHGPVPLFVLMCEFYSLSFEGPRYDRPLLMRKPGNLDEEAFQASIEKQWLQYMSAQGRKILRLRWNPKLGVLEEF